MSNEATKSSVNNNESQIEAGNYNVEIQASASEAVKTTKPKG